MGGRGGRRREPRERKKSGLGWVGVRECSSISPSLPVGFSRPIFCLLVFIIPISTTQRVPGQDAQDPLPRSASTLRGTQLVSVHRGSIGAKMWRSVRRVAIAGCRLAAEGRNQQKVQAGGAPARPPQPFTYMANDALFYVRLDYARHTALPLWAQQPASSAGQRRGSTTPGRGGGGLLCRTKRVC